MKLAFFAVTAVVASLPIAAHADTLTVSGKISFISALLDSNPTALPAGTIGLGDDFTLSANFDLSSAELTALYDADPTTNIYWLPGTTVSLQVGTYNTTFSPTIDFNSSVQLWNDRDVVGLTDSQSFSFFHYDAAPSNIPFDLGTGLLSQSVNFGAYDFAASARNSDLISEWVPFSNFGSQLFEIGMLNFDTKLFVFVQGSVSSATLTTTSVPEPASWAMMIGGLAFVGATMRRRSLSYLAA